MVNESPAHLKSFVVTLVRDAAAQMDELNAVGVVESQGGRAQVAALNCLRQDDHSYHDGQHRKSNVYNGLTCNGQRRQTETYGCITHTDLWYWLISHVVGMHETDKSH